MHNVTFYNSPIQALKRLAQMDITRHNTRECLIDEQFNMSSSPSLRVFLNFSNDNAEDSGL